MISLLLLTWKMTWPVYCWTLNIFAFWQQTGSAFALIVAHVVLVKVVFSCFHICSVHVQQLSHWTSCTVGGPRALCLFINCRGGPRGGRLGRSPPPKTYRSNFFTIILYNSENNIRDITPFFRSLFCHRIVVKYASSLLQ